MRRPPTDDPVAHERAALTEQHDALERLKRQLAERVAAVKEREDELRKAIAKVAAGKDPAVALPPRADPESDRLAARSLSLAERERALAAREAAFAERAAAPLTGASSNGDLIAERADLEERSRSLEARFGQLEARERAVTERERIPPDPDEARLAEIEARLDELRAAEEAFLRTRRELSERSDAVDARERLASQRERELDERDDGWGGGPDMHEVEARLRRLESQRTTSEQTRSFSGGFRKLEQEGSRRPESR